MKLTEEQQEALLMIFAIIIDKNGGQMTVEGLNDYQDAIATIELHVKDGEAILISHMNKRPSERKEYMQ